MEIIVIIHTTIIIYLFIQNQANKGTQKKLCDLIKRAMDLNTIQIDEMRTKTTEGIKGLQDILNNK